MVDDQSNYNVDKYNVSGTHYGNNQSDSSDYKTGDNGVVGDFGDIAEFGGAYCGGGRCSGGRCGGCGGRCGSN